MTIFRDQLSCWLLVRCSKAILTEDHDTKDPCMTSQRVPENQFLGSKLSKRTIPPIKIWLDYQILIRCFRLQRFASWVLINYYKKPRKEKTENYVKIKPYTDWNEWMGAVLKFIFKLHQIYSLLPIFFFICDILLWLSFVDILSWLPELNSNCRFDKMLSRIRLKTCNHPWSSTMQVFFLNTYILN